MFPELSRFSVTVFICFISYAIIIFFPNVLNTFTFDYIFKYELWYYIIYFILCYNIILYIFTGGLASGIDLLKCRFIDVGNTSTDLRVQSFKRRFVYKSTGDIRAVIYWIIYVVIILLLSLCFRWRTRSTPRVLILFKFLIDSSSIVFKPYTYVFTYRFVYKWQLIAWWCPISVYFFSFS